MHLERAGRRFAQTGCVKRAQGFSLLEVLIAVSVLSVGIIALAQVVSLTVQAVETARRVSIASIAADEKVETFRALPFGIDENGVERRDPALATSPSDALTRNIDGCFEYLDAAGRTIAGTHAATRASYVRRWSIEPLPAHPLTTIVMQVVVISTANGPEPSDADADRAGAHRLALRTRRGVSVAP